MNIEEIKKLTEQGEREFIKSNKVLIEDLPSFLWIPEFINIAGSLFYEREGNRKPNDIDVIVRAKEEDGKFTITLDESLRLKIDRVLEKRAGKMSGKWLTPEWLGSTFGPNWRYQTGWDLVLVPHQPQEIREMNEPEFAEEFYKEEGIEKKLTDKQKEEYDKETAIINENKRKPQAKEVHEFKAAKYTHPNGHPRCLICGDEEPVGGVCNMPDSWYQKHEFDDKEAWKKEREILREKGILKQGMDVEKLDLEEFKAEGIDDDLKNPAVRHKELFADLRYLGNSGYPKLKEGKKWGEWKLEDVLKYYAAAADALRSVYFPIISPKMGDKEYRTSYWECYRESGKHMKSKPPAEKEVKEWDGKRKKIIKDGQEIAKFTFKKIDEAEHIVGGVVYFSYKQDSQDDWTTPPEVWKALKRFMLKKKKLKVMHEGKEREIPIIENYFVEEQHHKGGMSPNNLLEKGDWWLAVYLGDKENKDIWGRVLKKELTGFSMAGRASSPS